MITEDYVDFEIAKLLKEKGFDAYVFSFYDDEGNFSRKEVDWNWNIEPRYSAPTLQMTMKWLREVHNLVVSVEPEVNTDSKLDLFYVFKIFEIKDTLTQLIYNRYELCDSYEEACELAIKYCLENLI